MEISFETKLLRDLCEDELRADQALGSAVAGALKRRLADIRAADAILHVLAGRPQPGRYQDMDCYRFDLADGHYLTVVPNHTQARKTATGTTDWERVRRIRVISVES